MKLTYGFVTLLMLAMAGIVLATSTFGAMACTTKQSCVQTVHAEAAWQNQGVSQGPRWTLSPSGCKTAGHEQKRNEARCRSYDQQAGGKTLKQCAKCLRQAIFDAARWVQCRAKKMAPPVPAAIYESIARLGLQHEALK